MNIQDQIMIKQARLDKLKQSPKNTKCPGVVRALEREIRNLKAKMGDTN